MPTKHTDPLNHTSDLPPATLSEHDGVRYLHLGTPWVQGAMRLSHPVHVELAYVQRMMAWMLWRSDQERCQGHAVQLGLGAGAITKFCRVAMRMRTTVVELNREVIAANHAWFRLPRNDRQLTVVHGDARAWVDNPKHAGTVDVLCVDVYDHNAARPVLDDEPFYRACYDALAPGGLMSVNLFGRLASFDVSTHCIAGVFGLSQVWQLTPTREGNTILVAGKGVTVPGRDILQARADTIEKLYGLPARKWLRMVKPLALKPLPPTP
jgi:spermidine synthase